MTVGQTLALSGLVPLDAQVLLAYVLERDRAWLITHRDDALTREEANDFAALARRRREGEPVAYLTGTREFFGLSLSITPAVLVPRPETETLVELALEWLPANRDVRVLDLGTGSGAIALAIAHERRRARVLATDASADALAGRLRDNYPRMNVRTGSSDPTGYDVVVNATPLGMKPGDPLPVDVAKIAPNTFVGEVVMKEEYTPFLRAAMEKGCPIQVGTDMLFEQIPAYLEFFGFKSTTPEQLRELSQIKYQ